MARAGLRPDLRSGDGLTIGRLDIPKAAGLIPSPTSSPAPTAASAPVTVSIPALPDDPRDYEHGDRDSGLLRSGQHAPTSTATTSPARRRHATGTPHQPRTARRQARRRRHPARRRQARRRRHPARRRQHGDDAIQHAAGCPAVVSQATAGSIELWPLAQRAGFRQRRAGQLARCLAAEHAAIAASGQFRLRCSRP